MNKLENILSKWNFKKIAVIYIIAALVAGICCVTAVGIIYGERLSFAINYSRLDNALEHNDYQELCTAVDKTALATDDVIDILVLNSDNKVTYSSKNSEFASDYLQLAKVGDEKKYLASEKYPDTVFKYVRNDEFMLSSILNKDFSQIRSDYDDDSFYDSSVSSKTIYMLSCINSEKNNDKIYVISNPTSVPGGMTAIKISAALAMFFFCVYWVLVALWLYSDAAKLKLSPLYWGLIGLLTNLAGVIVYKIYKHSITVCTSCGAAQNNENLYCSYCGNQLGEHCDNCGGKINSKDCFCCHCGHKVK